jgi:hypothetical protein
VNSYTQFIAEVNADFANYQNCKAGRNFLGQAACTAGLIGNVTFAVGRVAVTLAADGVKVGVKSLLAPLLATATFLQWVDAQVTQLTVLVHAPPLDQAARSQHAGASGGSAPRRIARQYRMARQYLPAARAFRLAGARPMQAGSR